MLIWSRDANNGYHHGDGCCTPLGCCTLLLCPGADGFSLGTVFVAGLTVPQTSPASSQPPQHHRQWLSHCLYCWHAAWLDRDGWLRQRHEEHRGLARPVQARVTASLVLLVLVLLGSQLLVLVLVV
jgi:hypothetical protein